MNNTRNGPSELVMLKAQLERKERLIRGTNNRIKTKDGIIKVKDGIIKVKEAEIKLKDDEIKLKDDDIKAANDINAANETEIQTLKTSNIDKDDKIKTLKENKKKLQDEIIKLKADINSKNSEIQELNRFGRMTSCIHQRDMVHPIQVATSCTQCFER